MSRKPVTKKNSELRTGNNNVSEGLTIAKAVPEWWLFTSFLTMLTIPNIIFSGSFWYESLFLAKWFAVFVPLGVLGLFYGIFILKGSNFDNQPEIDPFGAAWFLLVILLLFQPLWAPVRSMPTFAREWFFFASLWTVYFISRNSSVYRHLPVFLWFAGLNATLNVFFAEIQIRSSLINFLFIYPKTGSYYGNIAQQNMFALWVATALLGLAWLFLNENPTGKTKPFKKISPAIIMIMTFVCSWGLFNSTSRSGILSFSTGFIVFLFLMRQNQWKPSIKRLLLFCSILAISLGLSLAIGRGTTISSKAVDMVENVKSIGNRQTIWATSATMIKLHPFTGVGLGHFKWNYLGAQKVMLDRNPEMDWIYTHWAHNEILQWFCETGIIGGFFVVLLLAGWLLVLVRHLRKGGPFPREAVWACSLVFLFLFNSMWTRPFHRIENAVWFSFAFALSNMFLFHPITFPGKISREVISKTLGILLIGGSITGLIFFGMGMVGDRLIRMSQLTDNPQKALELREKALNHLMVRDHAELEIANLMLQFAEYSQSRTDVEKASQILLSYYNKQPQLVDLKNLVFIFAYTGNIDKSMELASYLEPGSYCFDGNQVYFNCK